MHPMHPQCTARPAGVLELKLLPEMVSTPEQEMAPPPPCKSTTTPTTSENAGKGPAEGASCWRLRDSHCGTEWRVVGGKGGKGVTALPSLELKLLPEMVSTP